jgi:AcrR family transcriptional regulator
MATRAQSGTRARKRVDRRTRAARAERTDARERLLAAAAKVFAERGYRAASVDDVAAAAGFSKGAVYWHFASKEDLLHTLVEERVRDRTEAMLTRLAEAPPEVDTGHEVGGRYMEMLSEDRDVGLLANEYWSLAARDPELRKRYAQRQRARRDALAQALQVRQEHRGTPDVGLPTEEAATAFLALASGLAMQRLIDPDAVPDHLYGEIVGLVYQGALATSEGRRRER